MKLKKMVALITAGALCLGMSMTAFAANSVTDVIGGAIVEGVEGTVENDYYNMTPEEKKAFEEAAEVLSDESKVKAELEKLGYDTKGKDVVVMGLGEYNYYDENGNKAELPKGSTVKFSLAGVEKAKGLKHGDQIYVMHYLGDGKWEVKSAKVTFVNGVAYAEVEMDSLSPVAFLKVMSNGKIVKLDKKGEVVSNTGRSPKTGE
ncbi:MAG: hypothetical protein HFG94_06505 [Dorea sp.]|jgi:hypothetical protein|nr:hypothetical protein [Dorea sp.]MCI9615335.1 hypothetical protein [Dorea sp.]